MANQSQNRQKITVRIGGGGSATIKGYKCGLPPMEIRYPCVITGSVDPSNGEPVLEMIRGECESRHLTAKPQYEIGDLLEWNNNLFLVVGYAQEDIDLRWRDEYKLYCPQTGSVVEFSIRFIDSQASLAA